MSLNSAKWERRGRQEPCSHPIPGLWTNHHGHPCVLAQWSLIPHSWDGPLHHLLTPGNALQWLPAWLAGGHSPRVGLWTRIQKTLSLLKGNLKQGLPGWRAVMETTQELLLLSEMVGMKHSCQHSPPLCPRQTSSIFPAGPRLILRVLLKTVSGWHTR